jgi:hypothetical protein
VPEQATIDRVASKFASWAEGLSPDEQATLADWLTSNRGQDVTAHSAENWWQESGAWSRAWTGDW